MNAMIAVFLFTFMQSLNSLQAAMEVVPAWLGITMMIQGCRLKYWVGSWYFYMNDLQALSMVGGFTSLAR
jgi:hypothetical protein